MFDGTSKRGGSANFLLLTADQLVADPWAAPSVPAAILIDTRTGRIVALGSEALARKTEATTRDHFDLGVLAPALIDCHVHLVLPGDGGFGEATLDLTDDELVRTSVDNATSALRAGVSAMQDQGSRGQIALKVRDATRAEPRANPGLSVAGRPITVPHGHMWYYGGTAAGIEDVGQLARQLVNDGVDLIKIVASGGGTKGSNELEASYHLDELKVAVDIAHEAGLSAAAHAGCREAIINALGAGCDIIHHCNFYTTHGVQEFDPRLAEQIARSGTVVDPTLWVTQSLLAALQPRAADGDPDAKSELERFERHWEGKHNDVAGLISAGVRLVAGSDAGWRYVRFGETWREAIALADFGLSTREAYAAATVYAAELLGMAGLSGAIRDGYQADVVVLPDDPRTDLSVLGRPTAVYRLGARVA